MKISAFVICKNEEKVITQCLESLKWADELVIVDGFSTDKTLEIAKRYTDKVLQKEWTNFSDQRNFALKHLTGDWVFYLDADEVASKELLMWIEAFKAKGEKWAHEHSMSTPSIHPLGQPKNQNRVDMIEIRRWEHFKGKLYKYGANNPSHQWRLFRREGVFFKGEVHEYPIFEGIIRRIEVPILHFPKLNLSEMISKMNRYTTLDAERLYAQGVKRPVQYMFFSGLAMFLKAYFRKQGFRDGILGFILAAMDGGTFFLRQAKLYLKNNS